VQAPGPTTSSSSSARTRVATSPCFPGHSMPCPLHLSAPTRRKQPSFLCPHHHGLAPLIAATGLLPPPAPSLLPIKIILNNHGSRSQSPCLSPRPLLLAREPPPVVLCSSPDSCPEPPYRWRGTPGARCRAPDNQTQSTPHRPPLIVGELLACSSSSLHKDQLGGRG
jgi:hypothetical protein